MNAVPLVIISLAVFALAYRVYYGFIAAKILVLRDTEDTPGKRNFDGHNYYPMDKWILFGHHFAAIAGAGPLIGPVLAAQFGYFPGFMWIVVGSVMAGGVHDIVILTASVRHNGMSLAEIAKNEVSKVSGVTASVAIFIIIILALAGLGIVVVNALAESSWGTFTIAATIPISIFMGLWMFKFRRGRILEATIMGIILLSMAVIYGRWIPTSPFAGLFTFDKHTLTVIICIYGFFASALPVWLLLSPRDYLSSIMKLGVVVMLAIGVIIVAPDLKMPAFTKFIHGDGPIIPGTLFPYLFITIACGAISGFHSLVSSGTTPKMLMNEKDIRFIAAGSMLAEAAVSILALIAASSLLPLDFFIINVSDDKIQALLPKLYEMGFTQSEIGRLSESVGEKIAGRPGGAVSLAVGMAYIFSSIPGLKSFMSYWYHFAIMFEALFILTTIDAGTRIARFVLQESLGKIIKPFGNPVWLPGNIVASAIVVFSWGYFIYTGSISTIWPMFGTANQLLAVLALAVGTSFIINSGKAKYAWITIVPMIFVAITTLSAGFMNIKNNFYPKIFKPETKIQGIVNTSLTIIIITCTVIIFIDCIPRWFKAVRKHKAD